MRERERDVVQGWDTSERKGGQSNSVLKPDCRDGGGWRKNVATIGAQGERGRSPGFFAFNQGYSRSAGSLFQFAEC